MTNMRAVYRDQRGATYSCPVEIHDGTWQMQTSEGFQPITFFFDDDIGGRLEFVEYREETQSADFTIRVERGSSWVDHKQAFAEQQIAEQRKARKQVRDQVQNVPVNPSNAARIAAAREHGQQIAAAMRPNGTGAGLIIEKK